MKKILTILFILTVALGSLSAKTAQIELITNVDSVNPEYVLKYAGNEISGTVDNPYVINIQRSLSDRGETNDFEIYLNKSNMPYDLAVEISIDATEFTTTVNNKQVSSGITPSVQTINDKVATIKAGLVINKLLYKFKLSWIGKSDLTAGTYTSDVTINYTVN